MSSSLWSIPDLFSILVSQPGVQKLKLSMINLSSSLYQGSTVRPGFGFLRDGPSLGMLREMMVMIRIWGLLKPGCLPIYTATSDNQDSMSLLFRLLTKLWLCCKSALRTPSVCLFFKQNPGKSADKYCLPKAIHSNCNILLNLCHSSNVVSLLLLLS